MTKRTESRGKRKHEPWQGATRALLLGCLAELYLLLIHKCYIYGTLDQVLSWYSYLKVSVWLGLAAAVLGGVLVYLSVENLSARTLPVGASYLHSRDVSTLKELYSLDSGVTARCGGESVPCGSFAAPLYAENAADASAFTLNLAAGRGAMLHCFCAVPEDWGALELSYRPAFAAGQPVEFVVRRDADAVRLGPVPATPAEVGSVVDL